MIDKTKEYRIDKAYGNVYKYDEERNAYLFYCKINSLSEHELRQMKKGEYVDMQLTSDY